MVASKLAAIILYAICMTHGGECVVVEDARVTSYAWELGGINCQEPCHLTAFMSPVVFGQTAACGPDMPWRTKVTIFMPYGPIVRYCEDRGGAITNERVDIAMGLEEIKNNPIHGDFLVLWELPRKPLDNSQLLHIMENDETHINNARQRNHRPD